MGAIAYVFHFPSSDIWEMDYEELLFWKSRAENIAEMIGRK